MPAQKAWSGWVLVASLAAGLGGCDSGDSASHQAASSAKKIAAPISDALRKTQGMVKAVTSGAAVAVDLRFELTQRPEIGKPTDIVFALIPTAPLERLYARFQPEDGLELVQGAETAQITRPVVGEPVNHTVTVTARRDGIFTIRATVLMDSASDSISRGFLVPVIAGSGLPEWNPKQAEGRGEAKAQRSAP